VRHGEVANVPSVSAIAALQNKILPAASKTLVIAYGSVSGTVLVTQTLLFRQRAFAEILQYTLMNREATPLKLAIHKRFKSLEN
jgi:hypothetical protein